MAGKRIVVQAAPRETVATTVVVTGAPDAISAAAIDVVALRNSSVDVALVIDGVNRNVQGDAAPNGGTVGLTGTTLRVFADEDARVRIVRMQTLDDGFADIDGHEVWLHGVHIPEYTQGTWTNHAARRKRKLLLNRAEIDKIERRVSEKGLTIVPLSLYFKDGRAKVEIGLARGKKTWDKRHALAERKATRETQQEIGRRLKGMKD